VLKDVTADLNGILAAHAEVQAALSFIIASPLLGRETLSAVLGEVSEHVIARFIGGAREARGNNGYDLRGPANEKIEVKARQLSRYGANLKFDFSKHSAAADEAFCITWNDEMSPPVIYAAFRATIPAMLERWGTPEQARYSIRTDLRR